MQRSGLFKNFVFKLFWGFVTGNWISQMIFLSAYFSQNFFFLIEKLNALKWKSFQVLGITPTFPIQFCYYSTSGDIYILHLNEKERRIEQFLEEK